MLMKWLSGLRRACAKRHPLHRSAWRFVCCAVQQHECNLSWFCLSKIWPITSPVFQQFGDSVDGNTGVWAHNEYFLRVLKISPIEALLAKGAVAQLLWAQQSM
ncbi:unnamed protein product [Ostreobium quekettii]|uniref:Uncharacterized protein n=1 Tax=Ostreobium quekettii TaxID=121088 RepID=A0A8S1JE76_9CHLO|nr:unnamed protein product [Ostreobium quekettii]